jgi:hypothetical protein
MHEFEKKIIIGKTELTAIFVARVFGHWVLEFEIYL